MGLLDFFKRRNVGEYWADYYAYGQKPNNLEKENQAETVTDKPKSTITKKKGEELKPNLSDNKAMNKEFSKPEDASNVANNSKVVDDKHKKNDLNNAGDGKKDFGVFSFKSVYNEKKNIIIFVLENTVKVNEHSKEILKITRKIVQDNKDALFLFLRTGNNKKIFELLDPVTIDKEETIDNLLLFEKEGDSKIDFEEALKYINDFLTSLKSDLWVLNYKEKKYDIKNNSIIFFGTAKYSEDINSKENIVDLIKKIKNESNVKTIKYFCMEDKETIDAAKLGFPVIGHIVADFYK